MSFNVGYNDREHSDIQTKTWIGQIVKCAGLSEIQRRSSAVTGMGRAVRRQVNEEDIVQRKKSAADNGVQ